MINLKTSLAYVFGLVSLIICFSIVSQGKLIEGELLPSPTPSATTLPKPEPFPGAARLGHCQTISQPRFFFYVPTFMGDTQKALTLSGTVYASDLTPLPNALVEIWPGGASRMNHPYPPIIFGGRLRTDEAGHYALTSTKFTRSELSYLHYRITYQDHCPMLINLHLVVEPRPKPAEHIVPQIQVVGPVLHGSVDIVLPVPPPTR